MRTGLLRITLRLAATVLLLTLAQCSLLLDTNELKKGNPSEPVNWNDPCQTFSIAYCSKLESCAPFWRNIAYGDSATCLDRVHLGCMAESAARDTSATPDALTGCSTELAKIDCRSLFTSNAADACVPSPGPRAEGDPCGTNGQCSTLYCKTDPYQQCGTCAVKGGEQSSCTEDANCEASLQCVANRCAVPAKLGEPCVDRVCQTGLACLVGKCREPLDKGQACTANLANKQGDEAFAEITRECDLFRGLYCDWIAHRCVEASLAGGGEPCGIVSGKLVLCSTNATCEDKGSGPKCTPAIADGQSCSITSGVECLPPATCINGSCIIPDPNKCN